MSNPKSLAQAVIAEGKLDNEIAENASLFLSLNVQVNSPTKWSESAEEPPLPATNI